MIRRFALRLGLRLRPLTVGLGLLFLASCLAREVEVRGPSDTETRVLSAEPSGDTAQELLVAVVSIFRWNDSTLVVSDRYKLHVISETTGEFVLSFGRQGRGSGEFQNITWAGRTGGDTLGIVDAGMARIAHISSDFRVRTQNRPSGDARCLLSDGSIVVTASEPLRRVVSDRYVTIADGLLSTAHTLLLYDRLGEESRMLDPLSATYSWIGTLVAQELDGAGRGPVTILSSIPLAPSSFFRCEGDALYWGHGSDPLIRRYSEGRTETIRLPNLEASLLTDQDRRIALDSAMYGPAWAEPVAAREMVEEAMDAAALTRFPYFVDLRIAEDGAIWVLLPRIIGRASDGLGGSKVWRVYSPQGIPLREIMVPANFDLRFITDEAMWGGEPGPFGDPRVVRRELR